MRQVLVPFICCSDKSTLLLGDPSVVQPRWYKASTMQASFLVEIIEVIVCG